MWVKKVINNLEQGFSSNEKLYYDDAAVTRHIKYIYIVNLGEQKTRTKFKLQS
jgi:hypothetical protein